MDHFSGTDPQTVGSHGSTGINRTHNSGVIRIPSQKYFHIHSTSSNSRYLSEMVYLQKICWWTVNKLWIRYLSVSTRWRGEINRSSVFVGSYVAK